MEIEEIPSTHDPDSTALYQLTKKAIQFPLRFDSETVPQPDDTVISQVKKQITTQYPIPTLSDSKTVDDEVEVAMELQEGVGVSLISKVSHFTVEPTGGHTVQATATVGVVGLQTELDPATGCLRGAVECLCSAESTHGESSTLLLSSADYFDRLEDSDEDEPREFEPTTSILPQLSEMSLDDSPKLDVLKSIIVEGGESRKMRIRLLLEQKRKAFSRSVREEPAHVSPMHLEVDYDKLKKAKLSGRARPLSEIKLAKLRDMLAKLLRYKVIRVSKQATGSQVLLVVKKGTSELRFCIDFRAINDATASEEGWPIPNIAELLREIGAHGGSIFGVMDMTSGYHQTPLTEESKKWTAFVTPEGMYEWNRVPMGIKAAPSYFSRELQNTVLYDLLHKIVLSYLDDLIVWGQMRTNF